MELERVANDIRYPDKELHNVQDKIRRPVR
jgi:hypothetical protein